MSYRLRDLEKTLLRIRHWSDGSGRVAAVEVLIILRVDLYLREG
ncbi:MAG: hypothetical protein Q7J85_03660 [Bacillota bacterium]|nr:hypothetical protein [Bacillota bacterium]